MKLVDLKPNDPDSKVHGANMGPTWVLSAQGGPQVGPMNLAIREKALMIACYTNDYFYVWTRMFTVIWMKIKLE